VGVVNEVCGEGIGRGAVLLDQGKLHDVVGNIIIDEGGMV